MQSIFLTLLVNILVLAVDSESGHSVVLIKASSPTTTITVSHPLNSNLDQRFPTLLYTLDVAIAPRQVPLDQVVDIKLKTCVECGNEWMLQTSPNTTLFKVNKCKIQFTNSQNKDDFLFLRQTGIASLYQRLVWECKSTRSLPRQRAEQP